MASTTTILEQGIFFSSNQVIDFVCEPVKVSWGALHLHQNRKCGWCYNGLFVYMDRLLQRTSAAEERAGSVFRVPSSLPNTFTQLLSFLF